MPEKNVRLIKAYYAGTRAFVRAEGEISKGLSIEEGVRKDCALSTILSNFVIDQIMKTRDKYKGDTR